MKLSDFVGKTVQSLDVDCNEMTITFQGNSLMRLHIESYGYEGTSLRVTGIQKEVVTEVRDVETDLSD